MMKLPAFALLAALAVVTAGGCRRTVEPQFAERSLDTVVRCGVVPCDLSYRFLTIANADGSQALAAIENANVNHFFALDEFTGTADEAARRFIERFAADHACDTLFVPDMRYSVSVAAAQRQVDTLTVYTIRRESYTGGAHGMRTTEYHNYWTEGGYELSLSDLFVGEELPRLTGRIKAKLYERYGAADDEELAQRGFFPEAIAPTENFEVTPEGIVFHYNPYDIACYAMGGIDVPFAKEELR
ncbi:RsiV family protein [Alistipes sp.]|uniref:RsiV family protein n=1 Tax=Alistipes sp. TaxID=1872444 RepID=UPI003A8648CF